MNDAIGGATSGTLNLTQTAIGGRGGVGDNAAGAGGNASSTLIGTNPYGSSSYNLSAFATGGDGGSLLEGRPAPNGGSASAMVVATATNGGTASASATAIGGFGGYGGSFVGDGIGSGGGASAAAYVTGPGSGSATATATGGLGYGLQGKSGSGGSASASAGSIGGPAIAKATGGNGTTVIFGANTYFGGYAGAASANAGASNGGSAVAVATGGNAFDNGGLASANATSTAMLGGTANATATATGGRYNPNLSIGGSDGTANANSLAATINGNSALAQSTATGSSGQAQATAQSNYGNSNSIQTVATSQVGGAAPAGAIAQVGGANSSINAGQSFSVANEFTAGVMNLVSGSMGAGGIGGSLDYQESIDFTLNALGAPFKVHLLDTASIGTGFDSATFQILSDGQVLDSQSFNSLSSADAFFTHDLLIFALGSGVTDIALVFDAKMSGGEGFGFDYTIRGIDPPPSATPLPAALPLFGTGLSMLGLLGWRRKRNKTAAIAAS